MRKENKLMQQYLKTQLHIDAIPKYIYDGSLKGTWRLYGKNQKWTEELKDKFNNAGFTDVRNNQLDKFSGNGGQFQVFVRNLLLNCFLLNNQNRGGQ